MAELKPCPFCGGEAKLEVSERYAFVLCKDVFCGAKGPGCIVSALYTAKDYAIEAWNRRCEDGK